MERGIPTRYKNAVFNKITNAKKFLKEIEKKALRKPINVERSIYIGDGESIKVEAIWTFKLLSKTGYYLNLKETFALLSFRRNLVYFYIGRIRLLLFI